MLALKFGMIIYYVEIAFKIWMLVDAFKKKAQYYWFLIIIFVPFGSIVYFFVIKIHDFKDIKTVHSIFDQPPSIDKLRYNLKQNPCIANKIQLAQSLYDKKEYPEAADFYAQVLASDNEYKQAIYGYGLCKLKMQDYAEAIKHLSKIIEMERSYKEYSAWSALASALWLNGQKQEALDLLEKLLLAYPSIKYKAELASYLIQSDRKNEAKNLLKEALEDYRNSPHHVKRFNSKWKKEAKRLLKTIESL